ncbi:MAG: efflux RND transporter permease subunit [Blastocatellia bacterium]
MQKLAEICVRRPVFATMLIMTLIVLGVFSYNRLVVERFPRVEFPTITITTRFPGAAPQEVETEITDKIEEAVNTISGIDELRSTSSEGVSLVFVAFDLERNLDDAAQDVRDKINRALPNLPRTIEQPTIEKLDPDASPIMTISVASSRNLREMTEFADKVLRRQIESVNGVGQVQIIGGRKRQVNVYLDGDKLRGYNLTITQVWQALQAQNLEVPGGRVEQADRSLTLRTLGRLQSPADFNDIVVTSRNGYPIKISDIGHTEDGEEDELTAGRLNDKQALLLQVRRQSGTNVIEVVQAIKARLEAVKKSMPPGYSVEVVRDQSTFILASFHAVREHLMLGSLLAALVVLVFMGNLRATIISAIAIPTSIISTFAIMDYFGITLNSPSMLGLTLSVGIVIDDAIVVLENIFRYIEEKGYEPFTAAIEATKEIGMAVMATTLSLVVIFLPVAFMQSIPGRFFKPMALTMSFAILVSLLVSFTLTPMLSARMLKRLKRKSNEGAPGQPAAHSGEKSSWIMRVLDRGYTAMLTWSLHHRLAICVIALLTFASTFVLGPRVGFNFFPVDDQSEFEVTVRAPEGTSLRKTLDIAEQLATGIRKLDYVDYTLMTIGDDQQRTQNQAKIYVKLADLDQRPVSQFVVMGRVREKVLPLFQAYSLRSTVTPVGAISGGGRANADVSFMLVGPNLDKLNEYSQRLLDKLRQLPGVVDADTSLIVGKPELRAAIDRQKAADLGVGISDIAQTLRLLVGGDQVSTYNENGEQYEVHVRASESFRTDAGSISRLNVPSTRLGSIGLDSVAKLDESTGPTQIERVSRQRQVMLTANLKPGFSQSDTLRKLGEEARGLAMLPGYNAGVSGSSKEIGRTIRGFLIAFALSFIFMYIVLAAQFESFIHPVTVLLALPLSLPFALLSLIVTGQAMNMFTLLGLLVLFGMVKKNSILQIDHTNGLRKKGVERHEALVQASRDRLRPILMTTIAFVAGMTPLALSSGPGSGVNRSTSVVVIGGQSLCLLLTLVVTPVAYSLFDDASVSSVWGRIGRLVMTPFGWARRKAAAATSMFLGLFR